MLAAGQIIASNSYQITLLTGEIGQSAEKLYAIAGIYLVWSLVWGVLTRYVRLLYLLTTPFFLYGLAFLLVGASPFVQDLNGRFWMQNVATGLYAAASASGSLFFAFNFGDEGKLIFLCDTNSNANILIVQAVHQLQYGFGELAVFKAFSMHTRWHYGSGAISSHLQPPQDKQRSSWPLYQYFSL